MNIDPNCSDAELNSAIAETVHAWGKSLTAEYTAKGLWCDRHWAISADAVLELLADRSVEINHAHREKIGWQWEVKIWGSSFFPWEACHDAFARAACLALLQAHGHTLAAPKRGK